MNKTIKKISLMLLLVISILPLSGCGKKSSSDSMDNAFDALSELKIKSREVEYSEDYINAMTQSMDEAKKQEFRDQIKEEKTYEITISNPTDHYYNYAPVGFIFDKDKLTQEDLESKDYTMMLIPLTLAPGDKNVIHLTPDTKLYNGDKITIAPYLSPFKESAIGSKVKDSYGSSSNKDSDSDSKDNNKDSNKDKKNKDKSKYQASSDSVNNTVAIKSDSNKNDSKDSDKNSQSSSDDSSRDEKYIKSYISDEKSSQVVYPGDVEFGKPQKDNEAPSEDEGIPMAGYTTKITNNSDATLKLSADPNGAYIVMFGMLSVKDDTINAVQVTAPKKDLKLKSGESGDLFTLTMGTSSVEPNLIFNGYGPAKGASDTDSKESDKDSSKDSDKNKDKSKDSDKNKDKKSK